jgi:ferrous iron transport protein B
MYRAGTMILAAMIVVWALLYFPRSEPDKTILTLRDPETGESEQIEAASYDLHVAYLEDYKKRLEQRETRAGSFLEKEPFLDAIQRIQEEINHLNGTWKRQSLLGRLGRFLEPGLRPLGWDWKVGGAALASFPAREVVVGTLSIVYNLGPIDPKEVRSSDNIGQTSLGMALKEASWDDNPQRKIFTVPAALSFLVFFALCCQCISTLAVIRRETQSWLWPAFTFTYMTILAYIGALGVYQVGTWISGG